MSVLPLPPARPLGVVTTSHRERALRLSPRVVRVVLLGALAACGTDRAISPDAGAAAAARVAPTDGPHDVWFPIASMPTPRTGLVAASSAGRVYAIGGASDAGRALAAVEVFAPNRNRWDARAPLPEPRRHAAGAVTPDGEIFVLGGFDSTGAATRSVFAYSSASNTWARRADLPVTSVAGIAAVIDGTLYLLTPVASGGAPQLHRYDASRDVWSARAAPPRRHARGVGGVIEGRLYVAGGDEGRFLSGQLDVYEAATDRWTTRAPMPTARTGVGGHAVDGKLYVMGGSATLGDGTPLATVEVYDAATDRWTTRTSMPAPGVGMATANLDGHLPTIGGTAGAGGPVLSRNEVYIP
jgi:N-acetylneuraminic acid mutarotase